MTVQDAGAARCSGQESRLVRRGLRVVAGEVEATHEPRVVDERPNLKEPRFQIAV